MSCFTSIILKIFDEFLMHFATIYKILNHIAGTSHILYDRRMKDLLCYLLLEFKFLSCNFVNSVDNFFMSQIADFLTSAFVLFTHSIEFFKRRISFDIILEVQKVRSKREVRVRILLWHFLLHTGEKK